MKLFLDTNIISELRLVPKQKANATFTKWALKIKQDNCWTSSIVLMELERGIFRIERKDPKQGQELRYWFENFVKNFFENRILNIDQKTAAICASLHIPNMRPENDAWIAASCIQHNLVLVSRNVSDFQNLNLQIINPFE